MLSFELSVFLVVDLNLFEIYFKYYLFVAPCNEMYKCKCSVQDVIGVQNFYHCFQLFDFSLIARTGDVSRSIKCNYTAYQIVISLI